MPIFPLDPRNPDRDVLRRAAELLRGAELVAFPTETVYGLGANALDENAVQKIFALKQRPSYNPLIVHVEDEDAAQSVVESWPQSARDLAREFWPGPLSLVLPRRAGVSDSVTAGLKSVAVRAPAHPVAQMLLRECGVPLAAPSANRFTCLSPTTAQHVAGAFPDLFVLDGGACAVGIESTVLDLSGATPILLRPGAVSQAQIVAIIGPVGLPSDYSGDAPRPSPGLVEKHYAPRAELFIVPPNQLHARLEKNTVSNRKSGVLSRDATDLKNPGGLHHIVTMAQDAIDYARELYAALHALDAENCVEILVEEMPDGEAWRGVRDRLSRAAKK